MIMNVAVPLPKHSPMFGQDASSHTVCRLCSRRIFLISEKRGDDGARTRIHSGFCSARAATTLIGMRAVLASPLCLTPAALAGGGGGSALSMVIDCVKCAASIGASSRPRLSTRARDAEVGSCVTASPG